MPVIMADLVQAGWGGEAGGSGSSTAWTAGCGTRPGWIPP